MSPVKLQQMKLAIQKRDIVTIVNVNWCRVQGECECIDSSEGGRLDSRAVDRDC